MYLNVIISSLPAADTKLEEIKSSQQNDPICKHLTQFCLNGWPSSSKLSVEVKRYMPVASKLSVHEGLLMRNNRIVKPKPLQAETPIAIHKGQQGITKCRECAKRSVWWPGLSKEVEAMVKNCSTCCKTKTQYAEPMISTQFLTPPWQQVGTDLFEYKGMQYLLVIDFFHST